MMLMLFVLLILGRTLLGRMPGLDEHRKGLPLSRLTLTSCGDYIEYDRI